MTTSPANRPVANLQSPAQQEFEAAARAAGVDPDDPWIGGYADYEWDHLRPLLAAYGVDLGPADDVLEFGCNAGGSTVVMAALGATVTGIDVAADMVAIAQANIARHGLGDIATARHVADTRTLPFADGSFDFVLANSVLEYVADDHLEAIICELHRVTRPGAKMLICGTASRLSPREVHSRRWLVNYVPKALDGLVYGKPAQRGLSPYRLARLLRGRFVDAGGDGWMKGRQAVHGGVSGAAKLVALIASFGGASPGWLSPNIEVMLKRVERPAR